MSDTDKKPPRVKVAYVISNGPGTLLSYGRDYEAPKELLTVFENPLDYPGQVMALSPSKEFEGMGE